MGLRAHAQRCTLSTAPMVRFAARPPGNEPPSVLHLHCLCVLKLIRPSFLTPSFAFVAALLCQRALLSSTYLTPKMSALSATCLYPGASPSHSALVSRSVVDCSSHLCTGPALLPPYQQCQERKAGPAYCFSKTMQLGSTKYEAWVADRTLQPSASTNGSQSTVCLML